MAEPEVQPQAAVESKMYHYSAVDEAHRETLAALNPAAKAKTPAPVFETNVRSFENLRSQVVADLQQWLGFPPKERLAKLALFPLQGPPGERADERLSRLDMRWKCLCFIIQEESRLPTGSREVAAKALDELFKKG